MKYLTGSPPIHSIDMTLLFYSAAAAT